MRKTSFITNIIFFCFLAISYSCKKDFEYKSIKNSNKHLMDFGAFSIVTPNNLKYKSVEGIDSFVGEILNDETEIIFDYGWYSPSCPQAEKDFISESNEKLNFNSQILFFKIMDTTGLDIDNNFNPIEIVKRISNLSLQKVTDSTKLSIEIDKKVKYYYKFEYGKKEYSIPFPIDEKKLASFKAYKIKKDTLQNYIRTIAISNEDEYKAQVCFVPINDTSNKDKLSLYVRKKGNLTNQQIEEMFKSIKLTSTH